MPSFQLLVLVPFLIQVNRSFLTVCAVVMPMQAVVGSLGFYYHTAANLQGASPRQFDNFVYGAPAMAPLLFPNLMLLVFLGLWVLRRQVPTDTARSGGARSLKETYP